jgi:DNA-binding NtrC family response regulator
MRRAPFAKTSSIVWRPIRFGSLRYGSGARISLSWRRAFLERASERHKKKLGGFRPSAIELLGRTEWPGNVRELQNEIERAVALAGEGETLTPLTFLHRWLYRRSQSSSRTASRPPRRKAGSAAPPRRSLHARKILLHDAKGAYEARYIMQVLAEHGGNVSHAAVALRLSRVALQKKDEEIRASLDR